MKKILALLLTAMSLSVSAQIDSYNGPVPTKNQLLWQDMEMYAFIHYSLNTYTDQEIWQTITFPAINARILKLDADRLASGERMGYGDIEVK